MHFRRFYVFLGWSSTPLLESFALKQSSPSDVFLVNSTPRRNTPGRGIKVSSGEHRARGWSIPSAWGEQQVAARHGGVAALVYGGRAHPRRGARVQAAVLLQRAAPRGPGAADHRRRRSLQEPPEGREQPRLPVGAGDHGHHQQLRQIQARGRRWRSVGESGQAWGRRVAALHVLAADVGHRGSAAGHRLALLRAL